MLKSIPAAVAFSLSDDATVDSILSDIPFICVGVMTFGILTFVLVLRRITLLSIYLYTASFFAFIAAIFDLGQTLTLGKTDTDIGAVSTAMSGLAIAREVALALTVAALYLFLWCLVAQCPLGEESPNGGVPKVKTGEYPHSASWQRWGLVGLFLKWSLLGLSFSIPILQIAWRVSTPTLEFGSVYVAEATIEVVVSALFILKIVLNISLTPLTPWWKPVRLYAVPVLALAISTGLGIANLVALAFSETTLGRFLRAVQIYLLILFDLVITFHRPAVSRTISELVNQEKPQAPLTGRPPELLNRRTSGISRLSSWIIPRHGMRFSAGHPLQNLDAELGVVPNLITVSPIGSRSSSTGNRKGANSAPSFRFPTPTQERSFTNVSIASYYVMARDSKNAISMSTPVLSQETDSPIYGLNGIIKNAQAFGDTTRDSPRPRNSGTSFTELLRQQTELDNSIAALRLFGRDALHVTPIPFEMETPEPLENPGRSTERSTSASTNSYVGQKPDSASNRSEFSLSIFPEPPAVSTDSILPMDDLDRFAVRSRVPKVDAGSVKLTSAGAPDQVLTLPVSPGHFHSSGRFDSAGTQYDVTSFIGGLTIPVSGSAPPSSSLKIEVTPNEVELKNETTLAVIQPSPKIDSVPLEPSLPERSGGARDSAADTVIILPLQPFEPHASKREHSISLRPLLLGTTAEVPLTFSSGGKVPIASRRKRGLPSNPRRPTISGPSPASQDGRGGEAPGAFERPRPPPLVFV